MFNCYKFRKKIPSPRWLVPPRGCTKLNTDGSHVQGSRIIGAGGVCRGDKGQWLFGFQNSGHGGTALVAEAVALRDGLALAWDKGFRWLECEVDSLELVTAVHGSDLGRFVPEIAQIQGMMRWQWRVSLCGIHRESNKVADSLAKSACEGVGLRVLDVPGHELQVLLLRDSLGVT